ncbi:MAG: Ca2+-dependent phosphoinositide-specific phospholipase C [Acidimicrobiales bacterium]
MRRLGTRQIIGALLVGAAALAACSDGDGEATGPDDTTSTTAAPVSAPGLHQVQVLAAHNAYHLEPEPALAAAIDAELPTLTPTIEYSHPTLTEQLGLGLRSFELDVYEDPEGGRYAKPAAAELLGLEAIDPVMQEPGLKVFHIQEVDYRSTCLTFELCLLELRDWSDANPEHLPIVIHLEAKDGVIPDPLGLDFVQPIPVSEGTFTTIEDEVHAVLGEDDLITVDEVQGEAGTLREAVETVGWPSVDDLRGRFLFVLDDSGAKRDLYRGLHPDTRDRLIFVSAQPPDDDAAFTVINDPVADGDRIRELVALGHLVRTRADADTAEARSGDTTRRDAAFASGAQIISTDYEREDLRFPGYVVTMPGGAVARCNPVSAPADCDPLLLE